MFFYLYIENWKKKVLGKVLCTCEASGFGLGYTHINGKWVPILGSGSSFTGLIWVSQVQVSIPITLEVPYLLLHLVSSQGVCFHSLFPSPSSLPFLFENHYWKWPNLLGKSPPKSPNSISMLFFTIENHQSPPFLFPNSYFLFIGFFNFFFLGLHFTNYILNSIFFFVLCYLFSLSNSIIEGSSKPSLKPPPLKTGGLEST